jgi:signal recognition particle receptor subunit beta
MDEYKILFTGTMGAGKTTAINAVSDGPAVVSDVLNTDPQSSKLMTTVGLDFGVVRLASGERVRLFGTPGQARFDFLWRILVRNALGMVILVDNSRPAPLDDLDTYLDGFSSELTAVPCVIGVGRMETHDAPSLDAYAAHIARRGLILPLMAVDVRRRDDVLLMIDTLMALIEVQLEDEH